MENKTLELIIKIVPTVNQQEVMILYPILETYLMRPHNSDFKRTLERIFLGSQIQSSNRYIFKFRDACSRDLLLLSQRIYYELGGSWYFRKIEQSVSPVSPIIIYEIDVAYTLVLIYLSWHPEVICTKPIHL